MPARYARRRLAGRRYCRGAPPRVTMQVAGGVNCVRNTHGLEVGYQVGLYLYTVMPAEIQARVYEMSPAQVDVVRDARRVGLSRVICEKVRSQDPRPRKA